MHGPPSLTMTFQMHSSSRVKCIFRSTLVMSIGVLCMRSLYACRALHIKDKLDIPTTDHI